MTKGIARLLSNQRSNYITNIESAKATNAMDLRGRIFRDIAAHVTPFALRRVLDHYNKLNAKEPKDYTNSFTTVSRLPYIHRVQARMAEGAGVIHIDDIHPHWRYEKPAASYTRSALAKTEDLQQPIDPLLAIYEPAVARPKGRPQGPIELPTRTELAFQQSTRREPSKFKRVEAQLSQRSNESNQANAGGRGRGRARGRARGRGRGPTRGRGRGPTRGRGGDSAVTAPAGTAPTRTAPPNHSTIESSAPDHALEASEAKSAESSDPGRASESDSKRIPLAAAPRSESEDSGNESGDSMFKPKVMVKLAISEDPHLEERRIRLDSEVDFGGKLKKMLDDHIYYVQRHPKAARAAAKQARRF